MCLPLCLRLPLCLLLNPFLFLFFLQDFLQSLLQSGYFFLEISYLRMCLLDLHGCQLEKILLGFLIILEGMFEGFHVMVDFLGEFIQVAKL